MRRITLIEDNPDNRLLVHAMIGDQFDIEEFETGDTGLAGVRKHLPDLILMDISLPGKDGTEVLKEIRLDQELKNIPVIALTAHAMQGDRDKYLAMGFNEYLTKPIEDENLLLNAISSCLAEV